MGSRRRRCCAHGKHPCCPWRGGESWALWVSVPPITHIISYKNMRVGVLEQRKKEGAKVSLLGHGDTGHSGIHLQKPCHSDPHIFHTEVGCWRLLHPAALVSPTNNPLPSRGPTHGVLTAPHAAGRALHEASGPGLPLASSPLRTAPGLAPLVLLVSAHQSFPQGACHAS